jgi:hypothetical protein
MNVTAATLATVRCGVIERTLREPREGGERTMKCSQQEGS